MYIDMSDFSREFGNVKFIQKRLKAADLDYCKFKCPHNKYHMLPISKYCPAVVSAGRKEPVNLYYICCCNRIAWTVEQDKSVRNAQEYYNY
jgi:hypothetical protein